MERHGTGASGIWAALRSLQGDEILKCIADRLNDREVRLTVPAQAGLAVGQRYEVALEGDASGDGQYATVVQTSVLPGDPRRDVAVGLRFDHPLFL